MVEVKADALEQSFDAFEDEDDGVAALKAELELLKSKIASGAIAAQRPALDGVTAASVEEPPRAVPPIHPSRRSLLPRRFLGGRGMGRPRWVHRLLHFGRLAVRCAGHGHDGVRQK
jgi:hypothetical protein